MKSLCRLLGHRWQKLYWHDTRYVVRIECGRCLKTPYEVLLEQKARR